MLEELVELEFEVQRYSEDEPIKPVLSEPCPASDLQELEAYLQRGGLVFPRSYRQFLSLTNGIVGFKSYFSLVPAVEVTKPPHAGIKRGYPKLAKFVVGRGQSLEFIAFDQSKASGEELEVVSVADDGEESRYPDFATYLSTRLQRLKTMLAREQADRKKLKK
jgi:hypothetical protein